MEGIGRILLSAIDYSREEEPLFYLIRLMAFLLIIYAILDKNRVKKVKYSRLSWQIVPSILPGFLQDKDAKVVKAMLQMVKLDIAALKHAYARN